MLVEEFDYDLPEELIAQKPVRPRDHSRLLVLDREKETWQENKFNKLMDFLSPGDCLVLNDTRVIPARLMGKKKETDGEVEVVLLNQVSKTDWEALVKPGRRLPPGTELKFGLESKRKLEGIIKSRTSYGGRVIQFKFDGEFMGIINELGEMPIPPYIKRKLDNKSEYQTVYAENEGSAAAPTAGLHFTEKLLNQLTDNGVEIASVTLHVGLGTFRPVRVKDVEDHEMHAEFYRVPAETVQIVNRSRDRGGRIIAVGTTTTRTLETVGCENGYIRSKKGWTNLFIVPGYSFQVIDGLITNFHLPCSTLLMMVSAFAGRDLILKAYKYAVKRKFRFYTFGDAMLII